MPTSENSPYQSLSPCSKPDSSKHYIEALEFAINDPTISNIAITGEYGSGKSTIIESYISTDNNSKECIKVSLAAFAQKKDHNSHQDPIQEIERSILQQIFYQHTQDTLPNSRFKRITNPDIQGISTVLLLLIIFLTIFLTDGTLNAIATGISTFSNSPDVIEITFKILFYASFFCIAGLSMLFIVKKITDGQRLNLKIETVGEIAVDQKEGSILNQYFDEILYFFEQTGVTTVFIEDLDRFEKLSTTLFTKLREINLLLNSSPAFKNKNINFVYALKDDLFQKPGERTKFFDFIVPVIPFVNYSNAGAKLWDGLNKPKDISKNLVLDLARYVSEMRVIYNILNEFYLYKLNLNLHTEQDDTFISPKKLLCFIVYKNVFPIDFAALNKGTGDIYTLLQSRATIISNKTEKSAQVLSKLELEKKELESLISRNTNDNKKLFFINLMQDITVKYPRFTSITTKTSTKNKTDLEFYFNIIFIDSILDSTTLTIKVYHHHHTYTVPSELKDSFKKSENKEHRLLEIEEERTQVKKEIENIKSLNLSQLLKKYPDQQNFLRKKLNADTNNKPNTAINDNDLLIYLVSNGYIDRNYHHYLTYYHASSPLSLPDINFTTYVNSDTTTPDKKYDIVELDSPEHVLEELISGSSSQCFTSKKTWNYSLVNYLLSNHKTDQIRPLIEGFKEDDAYSLFIENYFKQYANTYKLIMHFSDVWPEFYTGFIKSAKPPFMQEFFVHLLNMLTPETWQKLNTNNSITHFIQNHNNLSLIVNDINDLKNIEDMFKTLNITLNKFTPTRPITEKTTHFLNMVLNNNHYELNLDMVRLFIDLLYPTEIKNLKTNHLSTLLEGKCEALKQRVQEEFSDYIQTVFSTLKRPQNESPSFLKRLFNGKIVDELTLTDKMSILKKQTIEFTDLIGLEKDLWSTLLENKQVEPTWKNMAYYFVYSEYEIDAVLKECLKDADFIASLSHQKMNKTQLDKIESDLTQKLSLAIINSSDISTDLYDTLIKASYSSWPLSSFNDLKVSQLKSLITHNKLIFNQDNLDWLFNKSEELALLFLLQNEDKLAEELQEENILISNIDLLKAILTSDRFTITLKLTFIDKAGIDLTEEINHDEALTNTLSLILKNETNEISPSLLLGLMSTDFLENDKKLNVLTTQINYMTSAEIFQSYLKPLGEGFEKILIHHHVSVTFKKSDALINFFSTLKDSDSKWVGKIHFPTTVLQTKLRVYTIQHPI